jgi:hypothetical protein
MVNNNITGNIPIQLQHISLTNIIFLFVGYLLIHIFLILAYNHNLKKLENNKEDKELIKTNKILKLLSRWWPAIFVVMFILFNIFS